MRPRWPELVSLATDYLQRLIKFDTTNPPGSEEAAARFLQDQLDREGISSRVYAPAPGRANLVARLSAVPASRGDSMAASDNADASPAPLLLLSHLDVVPADPSRWRFGPFSGDVAEGAIWGRGAVDGKGPLAAFTALLVGLKRCDLPLRRDVILVAAADGEGEGRLGIDWLLERFPAEVAASAAITMGGGWPIRIENRVYLACANGEKGSAVVRLTAHGMPGHGAYFRPNNALVLLGKALSALEGWEAPVHVTPGFQLLVEELATGQDGSAATRIRSLLNPLMTADTVRRLAHDEDCQETLLSMCRNSFCPTLVRGGCRPDVASESAEAMLDCRILPGQTGATACAELEARFRALGLPVGKQDGSYVELQILKEDPPTESPPHTQLTSCLERALRSHRQFSGILPAVAGDAGGGRRLRYAGVLVYGFFPLLSRTALAGVHGDNERLDLASLGLAVKVLWDAVVRYTGGEDAADRAGGEDAAVDAAGGERSG